MTLTCLIMDESHEYNVKWKKTDIKENTLYDSIYIKFKIGQTNLQWQKNGYVRGYEGGLRADNILYLDKGVGYTGVYIHQAGHLRFMYFMYEIKHFKSMMLPKLVQSE